MLVTIRDDTWNALNAQHITLKSERWDYSDIPSGGHKRLKDPPTWLKLATTLKIPPPPSTPILPRIMTYNVDKMSTTRQLHYSDVIMSAITSQITGGSIVYPTVCSGTDQRKYQSSASLAFEREIHRWPVKSPHKGTETRKMLPFDDIIMFQLRSGTYGAVSKYHKPSYH